MIDELTLGDILGIETKQKPVKRGNAPKRWRKDLADCVWMEDMGREIKEEEQREYEAWVKKITGGEPKKRTMTMFTEQDNLFFYSEPEKKKKR
ncbi:unknown [Acidaminococcus sp. CAG:917]|nr:unknown [Acidaminococcus sp. CAG:917]